MRSGRRPGGGMPRATPASVPWIKKNKLVDQTRS
jgi:hypothetical protein